MIGAQKPKAKPVILSEITHYFKGKRDGVFEYAWMKNGTYFVGTCGSTLKQAHDRVDKEELDTLQELGLMSEKIRTQDGR